MISLVIYIYTCLSIDKLKHGKEYNSSGAKHWHLKFHHLKVNQDLILTSL